MTVFHVVIYLSLLIFFAAVIARIIRIAKMPVHLRWELYPVPHEKGRSSYGGSMLEEVDWWTKKREKDMIGEVSFMIPEILFLKGVWDHNRGLWFGSWTLHFGLYLLIGELGLLVLAGILSLAGVTGGIFSLILNVAQILAWVGCTIGVIGAVVMFLRRLTDQNLRRFNSVSHYFNLLLLGAIYVTGFAWVATDPVYTQKVAGLFAGWFSLSELPVLPVIGYWHVGVVLLFLVYFPFTHMTHAFVKYFTWHDIRWEDEPNLPGGELSGKIGEMVSQPVTWAAPHVRADGKKNWMDIVVDSGEEKEEA